MSQQTNNCQDSLVVDKQNDLDEPPLYKVLLHNDDYTSMEFVVSILEQIFQKNSEEAVRIMLNVHEQGVGVAGVYTKEICETKIAVVHDLARRNEFPLRCSMEKA